MYLFYESFKSIICHFLFNLQRTDFSSVAASYELFFFYGHQGKLSVTAHVTDFRKQ